jgi:RNA polymerase sigma factor (sigma-70 family)
MHDRDIVAAIVAGDPVGLEAAYDSYAMALHAYCRTLLAEPADAADAVQDTFVIAAAKLDQLRDLDRLRPWLYAVARNECHRRLRSYARQAGLDEAGEMTDASADAGGPAERAELKALMLSAIAGLNPGDREIIELNLRHDLDGGDLADTLGVPANQAHALASRARSQLERSLGALLVARTGRRQCTELDEMLSGWDGALTILLRKRVARHIESCDICGARKRRELSPAMLLSILPLVTVPAGLRQQVLRLVSDSSPDAVRYRGHVATRAEPFTPSGFPVQIAPAGQGSGSDGDEWPGDGPGAEGAASEDASWAFTRARRRRPRVIVFGSAAALVLLVGGGSTAYALIGGGHHTPPSHKVAAGSPLATAEPSAPGTTVPAPSPDKKVSTPTPTPTTSAPAVPPPGQPTTAPPTRRPSRPPRTSPPVVSPSPSPTKTKKPPASLSESPSTVVLSQPVTGGPYSGQFTLTAIGGTVNYSISGPATLLVTPASGSLTAGQTQSVTVSVNPNDPPAGTSTLTVTPGSIPVTVEYDPPSAPALSGLPRLLGLFRLAGR